ncbi:DUF1990 domain-containing protein [Nocardia terpenica]|uniref:DUF1990 family protein n=1 Tax=Nocardia terpenica TaxID=455432 RepID=UPI002FE0F79B
MATPPDVPPFTYSETGATNGEFPPGYHHFRLRRRIGAGQDLFESTAEQILSYRMQRGTGIFAEASTPTAHPGTLVTVRLPLGPFTITAPCRVVYTLDDPHRRGFAYGTLPGHPESGEELFATEYDPTTTAVYALTAAFSRPATWYTRLGGPITRLAQRYIAGKYIEAVRPPQ